MVVTHGVQTPQGILLPGCLRVLLTLRGYSLTAGPQKIGLGLNNRISHRIVMVCSRANTDSLLKSDRLLVVHTPTPHRHRTQVAIESMIARAVTLHSANSVAAADDAHKNRESQRMHQLGDGVGIGARFRNGGHEKQHSE